MAVNYGSPTDDFGNGGEHMIEITSMDYQDDSGRTFLCLGGQYSCPPEDVGGPGGYEDFCAAVSNKSHPEHKALKDWSHGCGYPKSMTWPDGFKLDAVNRQLAAYEKKLKPATAAKNKPAATKKIRVYVDASFKITVYAHIQVRRILD